ncbi:ABC transporter permease [Methylobrevis albus]|uniref:ABC transporter permease n=1 Tax=Methylobrevis albus TaxID=2793297 RepID=A0A931HZ71_9HYPH|nr:ABC transporter permease [Methylobrevis albus]MBH0237452.1 ABC transporter permease [Methylobrevis albus]
MQDFEKVLEKSATSVANFEEDRLSPLKRFHHFLHAYPTAAPALVLGLAVIGFALVAGDRFLTPFNLSLVLQQVTIIGIIGVAQTLIILTAGIDLSVGAIMVLSSVVMGKLAITAGLPVPLAFGAGIITGMLCGLINGILVTLVRLPPFIVTLGTWSIFFALNLWYSGSQTIRSQEIAANAGFLQFLGTPIDVMGARITYGTVMMILLFCIIWYALNRTAWGRHVYAVGDDPDAARLSGINSSRILLSVYIVAGLICAIGGWALIGRIGSISPQAGQTANLDSITAVVIGGTSLFGGRGSIFGTLIGALIVGIFRNGLALSGVDVLWQEFTIGLLIIVAVGIDQWIRKVSS